MNRLDYSEYPIVTRGVKPGEYRGFNYKLGDPRQALATDIDYYLSLLRNERWSSENIVAQLNLSDYQFEKEGSLCQVLTIITENEVMLTQGLSKFINMTSSYFTETRLALAYILRDDTKHLDCLFARLGKGKKIRKLSNLFQFSLASLLSENDFSIFLSAAIILGKIAIRTMCKYIALETTADPVSPFLANMLSDEELHVAYAVAHLRYRLANDSSFEDVLAKRLDDYELYLIGVSGMDEVYFGAFVDLLGEKKVRDMVSEISQLRARMLTEAGLSEKYVRKILDPLSLERRGLC